MTAVVSGQQLDVDAVIGCAARAAAEVDAGARAPHEAVEAFRSSGLLGAAIPAQLGGLGWEFGRLVEVSVALGGVCSSAAAAFLAHQGVIGGLLGSGRDPRAQALLRAVAAEGLLLDTAVGPAPDDCRVFSRIADLAVAGSPAVDQLGYRGVRLQSYEAYSGAPAEVLPGGPGFGQTMRAWRHVLWSASWLGLTERLADQVRGHLQAKPEAARLRAFDLEQLVLEQQALLATGSRALEGSLVPDAAALRGIDRAVVRASRLVADASVTALGILGMAGYANRSPRSVARLLRDAMGASTRVDVTGIRLAAELDSFPVSRGSA